MIPLDYVLAVAVLTGPGNGCGTPTGTGEGLAELAPAVRALAQHWEVMDPREENHLLAQAEFFECDLRILRRRYQELAQAPLISDSLRFPAHSLVCELLEFNRAYQALLVRRHAVEGLFRAELADAIQEVDQLYRVWDALRDARSDCYYITVRRHALLSLRETIGTEAYNRGELPPHVPVWRFNRAD